MPRDSCAGMAAQQLAEALLQTEDAAVLRGLVLARCIGRCLTLSVVAPTLISKATSPTGTGQPLQLRSL